MKTLLPSSTMVLAVFLTINASAQELNRNENGPGSYKIKNDKEDPIVIPFLIHQGKPLMNLKINGEKATLMIDNGILWDQVWLFGSPLVKELKLMSGEESSIGGAGEGDPTQAFTADNITLEFEDIVFYEQPVLVSPPEAGIAEMFPGADGQLCNTFFKHFIVEFDFILNEVHLYNPGTFRYKGDGSVIDMRENESGTYAVPFSFTMPDGKIYSDRVDIDFGGIYPLKIALNNANNIQVPEGAQEIFSYGAQGKSTEYSAKISTMTIGSFTFENPIAVFGDEKTSRIHPDNLGVIGLPLFMKFNIFFDYFNNKLYLEPNKHFGNPF